MEDDKSNAPFFYALIAFSIYWIIALIVPVDLLKELFNSLSLGVAIMVALTWAPAAWHSIRHGNRAGEWQLVIAIFLSFCVLAFQRLYVMTASILNRPDWLINSPVAGFVPYSITVVGLLYLVAPGVYKGAPRGRYWWHILFAVAIGSLTAGILIGMSPMVAGE